MFGVQFFILFICIVHTSSEQQKCRAQDVQLEPRDFALHTCALCYMFMLPRGFIQRATPTSQGSQSVLHLNVDNQTVAADILDFQSPLLATFSNDLARDKWRECCVAATLCCRNMLNVTAVEGWCPATWDGWSCWHNAPSNSVQLNSCPPFISLDPEPPSCMFASKKCEVDGTWYRAISGKEWTNYSTCSAVPNLQRRIYISIGAYVVSIIALLPALVIFSVYRQLRVPRVAIHRQLFTSLLLNALAVIAFKLAVILPQSSTTPIIDQDGVLCKALLVLTKYLRLSNYMWMFCEAFYLHRLISAAFVQNHSLIVFYCIGWVFPMLPLATYSITRSLEETTSQKCWGSPDWTEWMLYGPCLISLAANFVFLVDIIRVLWTKLRARHTHEPKHFRKAVRATLVLVPLFGLHLCVTMYRPSSGACAHAYIQVYYVADLLLDGLQGCLVAITFCYCNGEVHSLLGRSIARVLQRQGHVISQSCDVTGMSLTDVTRRHGNETTGL